MNDPESVWVQESQQANKSKNTSFSEFPNPRYKLRGWHLKTKNNFSFQWHGNRVTTNGYFTVPLVLLHLSQYTFLDKEKPFSEPHSLVKESRGKKKQMSSTALGHKWNARILGDDKYFVSQIEQGRKESAKKTPGFLKSNQVYTVTLLFTRNVHKESQKVNLC